MNKRTKFNVDKNTEKRTYNDIVFDSILEMKFYRDVVLPQVRSGEIKKYELQKPYTLQPEFIHNGKKRLAIVYIADFYIEYSNGKSVVIDIKGCPDSVAKIKRKMFEYTYPHINYKWIAYSKTDGGWCEYEYIQKQRKERKRLKAEFQKEK